MENSLSTFKPEVLTSSMLFSDFQKLVYSATLENVDHIIEEIIQKDYLKSQGIETIYMEFMDSAEVYFNGPQVVASIFAKLYNMKDKLFGNLKKLILEDCFVGRVNDQFILKIMIRYRILRLFMNAGCVSVDQVFSKVEKLGILEKSLGMATAFYLNFVSAATKDHIPLVKVALEGLKKFCQKYATLGLVNIFKKILDNLKSYMADGWKLLNELIQYGVPVDSLAYKILTDSEEITPDTEIELTPFYCMCPNPNISAIEFAALVGSPHSYNKLVELSNSIPENIGELAARSGSLIILAKAARNTLQEAQAAVEAKQLPALAQILVKRSSSQDAQALFALACAAGYFPIILYLLEQGADPACAGPGMSPLQASAGGGSIRSEKFLLASEKVDPNCGYPMTPIRLAIDGRNEPAALAILASPKTHVKYLVEDKQLMAAIPPSLRNAITAHLRQYPEP